MQIIDSQIKSVTVFSERAQIERYGKIQLEAGQHIVAFDSLPKNLDQRSIQVNGKGKATLSNVNFRQTYQKIVPKADKSELIAQQEFLQEKLDQIEDDLLRYQAHDKFIHNLSEKLTQGKSQENELNPETWRNLLSFQQEELIQVAKSIRQANKLKQKTQEEYDQLQYQLNTFSQSPQVRYQVQLSVEVEEATEIILKLSYIVPQAGWFPVYDFRVDTESKEVQIVYNARVWQKTSEDWQAVKVNLSTASPQVSGKHPELTPWRLDLQSNTPIPPAKPRMENMMQASGGSRSVKKKAKLADELIVGSMEEDIFAIEEEAVEISSSSVETGATSVVFNVTGTHDIKNNSEEHQVNIMQETFSGHFRYSTIPKLSPFAYLKAKVQNESEYPFLAGKSNVFMDGNFVASSSLDTTAPNEEFWIFLGIDESMKVEHKFLRKYEQTEGGLFSKKTRLLIYEYEIKLQNKKKANEEIVVWDQLPISQNKAIKINLIEPSYKENTKALKKNEYDYLEWFFELAAGESQKISFKFSVEYPEDQKLSGS